MCAAWAVERGGEGSRHGKSRGVRHRAALAQARGTTNTRHRRTRSRRRRRRSIDGDIYHRVLTSSLTRWVDPLLRCSRWRCSWLPTFPTLARPWAATLRRDPSRPRGRSFLYAGAMQSSTSGRVTLEVISASHGLPQCVIARLSRTDRRVSAVATGYVLGRAAPRGASRPTCTSIISAHSLHQCCSWEHISLLCTYVMSCGVY